MVLSISYNNNPSLPEDIGTLYQCSVSADGKFQIPSSASNVYLSGMPIDWVMSMTNINRYQMIHNLNTIDVVIQITLRDPTYKYEILDIAPNSITIETLNADGHPAPMDWKYQLRKQNVVHT